jgi:Kef-type K+ transport system membrane component KefB
MPPTGPVPPIPAHSLLIFLLQVGLLLGLALVLGRVAVRCGMPALVGELSAGILVGPSVLAHAWPTLSSWLFPRDSGQLHLLDALGQIGVLLLVGITGMHLDLGLLRHRVWAASWVSAGGLLVPLGLGVGVGLLLPSALVAGSTPRLVFASFIGVALCVSAIPVIAKILIEMRLLSRDIGQLLVGAASVDDMVGWALLSVVAAMATTGLRGATVVWSVVAVLGVIAFTVLIGRHLVAVSLRMAARSGEPSVSEATAVALLVLFAAGTHALGLEPILGTFACGIAMTLSGQVSNDWLVPLRTVVMAVLAPLFFATAGLRMDLTALASWPVLLSAVTVLAVAVLGKFAGAYLGARIGRLSHWEGLALAAGLNARGVIEVVVATVGLRLGILNTASYTIIVLIAVVTSIMAPPSLRFTMRHLEVTPTERERERVLAGV